MTYHVISTGSKISTSTDLHQDFIPIKSNSIEIPLYGHKCNVISIDDLIKVKEAMNRPKDIQAVIELKKVKELSQK